MGQINFLKGNAQGLGELGQIATNTMTSVANATDDVRNATALVKKLTNEVKLGIAPRSDLAKALDDLNRKIKITETLVNKGKALNGYLGQSDNYVLYSGVLVIILLTCYCIFKK